MTTKTFVIEAHGRRGWSNTRWRKKFRSIEELNEWATKHDAVIDAVRDLDPQEG